MSKLYSWSNQNLEVMTQIDSEQATLAAPPFPSPKQQTPVCWMQYGR
jgi:hypothetical protein